MPDSFADPADAEDRLLALADAGRVRPVALGDGALWVPDTADRRARLGTPIRPARAV
jgi:hypothetical protein